MTKWANPYRMFKVVTSASVKHKVKGWVDISESVVREFILLH